MHVAGFLFVSFDSALPPREGNHQHLSFLGASLVLGHTPPMFFTSASAIWTGLAMFIVAGFQTMNCKVFSLSRAWITFNLTCISIDLGWTVITEPGSACTLPSYRAANYRNSGARKGWLVYFD
jgi:hypothetical protein